MDTEVIRIVKPQCTADVVHLQKCTCTYVCMHVYCQEVHANYYNNMAVHNYIVEGLGFCDHCRFQ